MKRTNNSNIFEIKNIKKIDLKIFKKKHIKNKLINNLLTDGKKNTGERIVLKSLKELQKYSNKQSKKLIQLSIISALPTFKVHKISNKKNKKKKIKEIPSFIHNKNARISLAIKFILNSVEKEKCNFFTKFKQEIILNSQLKSSSIDLKNELQKQALIKKHYLINYKWS
jgi:ribosomal protein S7